MIEVGSDFSGVGAFDEALKRLGVKYKTVFACDKDKFARSTYEANHGEPEKYHKDVYEREVPNKSLDFYMTSPPCQSFSMAGSREGEDCLNGVLFYNSYEFIKKNKPRYFIFENVKGLLSDNNGKTFGTWIEYLGGKSCNGSTLIFPHPNSVPYHIYHKVLNAKDYGVPQNRERIFIIGIRDDADNNFTFPKKQHLTKKLKDILEDDVNEKHYLSSKMLEDLKYNGKTKGIIADLNKGGERGVVYSENSEIMSCLTATDYKQPKQIEVIIKTSKKKVIRRLTPRECFRLMDFPDHFKIDTVSNSQAYKQAGNSIVVNVLAEIIKKLTLKH